MKYLRKFENFHASPDMEDGFDQESLDNGSASSYSDNVVDDCEDCDDDLDQEFGNEEEYNRFDFDDDQLDSDRRFDSEFEEEDEHEFRGRFDSDDDFSDNDFEEEEFTDRIPNEEEFVDTTYESRRNRRFPKRSATRQRNSRRR